tara:strand:+ start:6937 stop:7665 length:729 start_codon:yes stop_codon:yes gene_type:complete
MSFLRHVGKHGDRKVAVIFREVPNEEHMCLVAYTELLNQNIHDPMMATIESDIGQNSEQLADALNRTHSKSGDPILQILHNEGMLKKIRCEDVQMTPQSNTTIRLSELNKMLNEMALGAEATQKMAQQDAEMGYTGKAQRNQEQQLIGEGKRPMPTMGVNSNEASTMNQTGGALTDEALAQGFMQQADAFKAQAEGMMAEARSLMEQAAELTPAKPKAKRGPKPKAKAPAKAKAKTTRSKKS